MPMIGAVDAHHHLWDIAVSHYAWLHPNPDGDPFPDFEKICRDYTIENYRADIEGQGVANPGSILRSTAMLLQDLSERRSDNALAGAAAALEAGIDAMLSEASSRTADLGGALSTSEFGAMLAKRLSEGD